MKYLLLALVLPSSVFASDCVVGGISDSPQSYSCFIRQGKIIEELSLICTKGSYQIKWKDETFNVTDAYHEDVERGSSPLVFVADRLTLTTVSRSLYSRAYLETDGKELGGKCFSK